MVNLNTVNDVSQQMSEHSIMDCTPNVDVQGPLQINSFMRAPSEGGRSNLHKHRRKWGCEWPVNFYVLLAFGISLVELANIIVIYIPVVMREFGFYAGVSTASLFFILILIVFITDVIWMAKDPTEPLFYKSRFKIN